MGLRERLKRHRAGTIRPADSADVERLTEFAASRRGVEGFIEPETNTTSTTLALVAADGEWTRRRVASPQAAVELGQRLTIPIYHVSATGYPARMREWTAQQTAAAKRQDRPH